GFYRYLLTMLDGLQSESTERVCVMMTAMDPGSLPPALIRSGRVELWLETRLPDLDARQAILKQCFASLPAPLCEANLNSPAAATHGLTGADLRSVVEDGKLLFAHDLASGRSPRVVEEYFLDAVNAVRANHRNYRRPKSTPFGVPVAIGFGSPN